MTKWLPVVGYEGDYEVSDDGQVRSLLRAKPHVLRPGIMKRGGYPHVSLRGKTRTVHTLMLEAFVGPRPAGDIHGCHKDDVPDHNVISNLEWGTRSKNYLDAVRNGRHVNASKTHCKWGHEFTPENTKPQSGGRGRACRACHRRRSLDWLHKQKEPA